MSEWDEELIAEREGDFHQCDDGACQADQQAVRIARAEHNALLGSRALLAQRDGELEALRYEREQLRASHSYMAEAMRILQRERDDYKLSIERVEDQRDGVAEKLARVQGEAQRIYDMGIISVYESAQEIGEIFLAALSDNQESP